MSYLGEIVSHDNCPTCGAPFYKAKIARAAEWLAERFTEREDWCELAIFDRAKKDGISLDLLLDARKVFGVRVGWTRLK
jgi:hypothetical protein